MTDSPTITLGGSTFSVPQVVLRDSRKIVPIFTSLLGRGTLTQGITGMGEEDYESLMKAIYYAIKREQGETFTYEVFLDLPATPVEIMKAIPVVMAQAGLQKVDSAGEQTGEPASPQTTTP